MALDPAPIAETAAQFIDDLEEDFGTEAEIMRFAIVAQVEHGDTETVRVWIDRDDGFLDHTEAVGLLYKALHGLAESA